MAASTESYKYLDQSAFNYDYETLRTTGVILAVVMFVSGILIALSKKCKCSKASKSSPVEGPPPKTEVPLRQCKEDVSVQLGGPFPRRKCSDAQGYIQECGGQYTLPDLFVTSA